MEIAIPTDKSLTHRAYIFAAMAKGVSTIHKPLLSEDCFSTLKAVESLGCKVEWVRPDLVKIDSPGIRGLTSPKKPLDCGNSGTTTRLLIGLLASCPQIEATLIGDASLSKRPMRRVTDLLEPFGAKFEFLYNNDSLPLKIKGQTLHSIQTKSDIASAQVKSALILAGLNAKGDHELTLPTGSRDHTELFLKYLGIKLTITKLSSLKNKEKIIFNGPQNINPFEVMIPVDPSSASFFCVLGILHPKIDVIEIRNVMDNPTRLGFLEALLESGAPITVTKKMVKNCSENLVDLKIQSLGGSVDSLDPFKISKEKMPTLIDEVPILAVAAAFADGVSSFSGVDELRHKESDRLQQIIDLLSFAGVGVQFANDELVIHGPTAKLNPFEFDTQQDHRLAMSAAILERLIDKTCTIHHADCVNISFPNFYEVLDEVLS